MTGFRRGALYVFAFGVVALGAARGAFAQPTGSLKPGSALAKAAQSAEAAEYYVVGAPITLDQVLKMPDTTKVMGPDCKLTTVGEMKKAMAMHHKLTSPPKAVTGGSGKTSYGPGSAKAREAAAVLGSVDGEAQGSKSLGSAAGRVRNFVPQPGVTTVNGRANGFRITPGAHLTISGSEFGVAMGQVNLIGNFPGGAAALRVADWKADTIDALLPEGLRGVVDQTVSLQVVTSARRTFTHPGGAFTATREPQTVTTNVPQYLKFTSGPSWGGTMDASGSVFRISTGEHINCAATGADTLTLVDLPKGFVVTEVDANWNGRTDSGDGDMNGDGGSRTYSPGYGFGDWSGPNLPVRWGVWRNHTSPYGAVSGGDMCLSSYQISLIIVGPAGVSPF